MMRWLELSSRARRVRRTRRAHRVLGQQLAGDEAGAAQWGSRRL